MTKAAKLAMFLVFSLLGSSLCEIAAACAPQSEGKGAPAEAQVMSDGANLAWFEWSDSQGAFVQVFRWFDPTADFLPIQPDEFDASEFVVEQHLLNGDYGLLCSGSGGVNRPPTQLAMFTVRPISGGSGNLSGGFAGRVIRDFSSGGNVRLILRGVTLTYPQDVPVAQLCEDGLADARAFQALRGAVGPIWNWFGSWEFTAVFQNGLRTDYRTTALIWSDCGITRIEGGRVCQ